MKTNAVLGAVMIALAALACNSAEQRTESATVDKTTAADPPVDNTPGLSDPAPVQQMQQLQNSMYRMMEDMRAMTLSGDPDHDFAMMMKRHHQTAIEMANMEMDYSDRENVKQLAQKIMEDANNDNRQLEAFMRKQPPEAKSDFGRLAMQQMVQSAAQPATEGGMDTDMQFATLMEKHHRQGIETAELYLKHARKAETKEVANTVIRSNTEDIAKLRDIQQQMKKYAAVRQRA